MDLMTLDANNQPAKLIENYDSLIWTERFNTVGDFQLTSGDPAGFLSLLPQGTRLAIRESPVVMEVETHQIDRKKNSAQQIIIKGRAWESILDRRVAIQSLTSSTGTADWIVNARTPSDVAHYIIKQICSVGILDPADIFPPTMVQIVTPSDYLGSGGPLKNFTVPRGNLLSVVLDLLQTEGQADPTTTPATPAVDPHGIRSVRPASAATAISIQIYKGVDKTATVYFDGTRDLLDDGSYLFSKVGSANAAYGIAQTMTAKMIKGSSAPTGLSRRVILVDASSSGIGDQAVLQNQMSTSLAESHETAMYDGSINQDLNPYVYGVDYNLGDIVRLIGDYGLVENARVTEYIRSEDNTGTKAYPTLTAIPA